MNWKVKIAASEVFNLQFFFCNPHKISVPFVSSVVKNKFDNRVTI
jgi:hypothetical protein